MRSRQLFIFVAAGVLCGYAFPTVPGANAALFLLTGGDPGEGFTPGQILVAAVDFNQPQGDTVQGVTFAASSPNVTLGATNPYPGGSQLPSGTANDNALQSVMNYFVYSGNVTITLSGLTPGKNHQIDLFAELDPPAATSRTEIVTINGVQTDSFALTDNSVPAAHTISDVRNLITTDPSGNIQIVLTATGADTNAVVNAIAVFIPEPASGVLCMLLAAAPAMIRRRSVRR